MSAVVVVVVSKVGELNLARAGGVFGGIEGTGRGRGQLRHPPRSQGGGLVGRFSGGEGEALVANHKWTKAKKSVPILVLLRGSRQIKGKMQMARQWTLWWVSKGGTMRPDGRRNS